jgi:Ca2+-binding EF-hand superfamily protein
MARARERHGQACSAIVSSTARAALLVPVVPVEPTRRQEFIRRQAWRSEIARIDAGVQTGARRSFMLIQRDLGEVPLSRLHLMIAAMAAAAAGPAFATAAAPRPTPAPAAAPAAPKPVTRAEYLQEFQARFNAMDTNHDGVLDSSEVAAAQQKQLEAARAAEQQQLEADFAKLDTNHDGQLSKAEFMAAARPIQLSQTPQQVIADVDSNKDGKISLQEFEARPLANFDKVDANHDGIVTPQEVQAAQAAARKR